MTNIIVETKNLTRKYGDYTSVDQLNMTVKKGEIYGFLGPNGAGKTTTIRMLLGLIKPTSGSIYIFGKELYQHRMSILRKVGSLVEYPSYYGHLTGYENLEIIRRIIGESPARIREVLKIVRLDKVSDKLTREYSLGMKQRLGIAAALLGRPELLILDEPTNGLDPAGIQEIRELIRELPAKYGMTIIVSSHLLSEIDQIATQVGIILRGKLIFQGSIGALRQKSRPRLKIGVENPKLASSLLNQRGLKTYIENDFVWYEDTDPEVSAYMNHTLINEGLSVYRLEEVAVSLEDIFLELTGKEVSL
ncbi:ABC transporter ATP-binding protein [Polycladomyces sp. WAk]|uniref:ABC transporter ATP-binding protein n=1 Tax=Polycladomyces zharkentensis TaxID=2807616 RepID=A0ABS2WM07_9BACL|nr:ABC transporter ATP-binding protein [Polycladomyces sp. WAk]